MLRSRAVLAESRAGREPCWPSKAVVTAPLAGTEAGLDGWPMARRNSRGSWGPLTETRRRKGDRLADTAA